MTRIFQVLPPILRDIGKGLEVDFDFSEILRLYLENFDSVSVACPVTNEGAQFWRCKPVRDLPWGSERLQFVPLPTASTPITFARHFAAVRRVLRDNIEQADYLIFSPYNLIGDWPTVAIREAVRMKRQYVIEADVVYETVAAIGLLRKPLWRQAINRHLLAPAFRAVHRYGLRNSSLALLQGQAVFEVYAPFCNNPHKVYHMPIDADDYIPQLDLDCKLADLEKRPLRICYVGRAIDMKGPMDWLKIINELVKTGIAVDATWLGDGPQLDEMRRFVASNGLEHYVRLQGNVSDRQTVRETLRDSDIFLFCHKTSESPRCLVEALASGCCLIGYEGAYQKDIVATHGGGVFGLPNDWSEIADLIRGLDGDLEQLRSLIKQAAKSGRLYDRDATMTRRIVLIKRYMPAPERGHTAS